MPERLLVIGGDPGGMAAASQARRRRPDLEIVALEKGRWTSYSACGIPYVIGGDVDSIDELVVRTPEQHRANGIDARAMSEATVRPPSISGLRLASRGGVRSAAHPTDRCSPAAPTSAYATRKMACMT